MALTRATLQRIGSQNNGSISVFTYKTADTLATVDGSGYFNGASDLLKVGDMIMAYTTTGPAAGIAFVQANTRDLTATPPVSGVVDTTNFTAIGAIDSD
jgi:hypothetical protein